MHVITLYRRGELATLEEGALVAGVSRVTVRAWLTAARIDWKRAREHYLARQRSRAVANSEGRIMRRPSKRQLRERAERALQDWNEGAP